MKTKLYLSGLGILLLAWAWSCKTQSDASADERMTEKQTIVRDTFVLPEVPATLTNSDERAKFVVSHYWDRYDFSDRELIKRPEITEQAFVDYINVLTYVPMQSAEESLVKTLKYAEADSAVYAHFAALFDKYFYDPNSPFRNEAFYIPVLRALVKSPLLNEGDLSRYQFQLDMVMKNKVGDVANNFKFTTASGDVQELHSLKSDYTLLMFSNPGCPTCMAVTKQLNASQALNKALARNTATRTMLTILTVYPDNELDEWRAHLAELPKNWVHSYDEGMVISKNKLYDIKAIPTLYLLDKDKKVLLKDTSIEAIESYFTIEG